MKLCRNDPLNFLPFTVDEIPHEDFSEDEEDDEFDDVNEDDDERLNFYTASSNLIAEAVKLFTLANVAHGQTAAPPVSDTSATPAAPPVSATRATFAAPPFSATRATPAAPPVSATRATFAAPPFSATRATPAAPPVSATRATFAVPPFSATRATPAAPPVSDTRAAGRTAAPLVSSLPLVTPQKSIAPLALPSSYPETTTKSTAANRNSLTSKKRQLEFADSSDDEAASQVRRCAPNPPGRLGRSFVASNPSAPSFPVSNPPGRNFVASSPPARIFPVSNPSAQRLAGSGPDVSEKILKKNQLLLF